MAEFLALRESLSQYDPVKAPIDFRASTEYIAFLD